MGHELRVIENEIPDNIEELAALARQQRVGLCTEEVNAVLTKHNCAFDIVLRVGDQFVKLNAIVALPGLVQVVSK